MEPSSWKRRCLVVAGLSPLFLVALPGNNIASNPVARATSLKRCTSTLVHYTRYKGAPAGLAQLPWIAASPASTGLVGHLFYYDRLNAWRQKHLPGLRLYSAGQSPDGRISMKVLWESRRGTTLGLAVRGRRLDGSGSFSQQLSPTSSNPRQFPSIIDVPAPGCWRLTLTAGNATATVSALVVPGKTS
jgi:hypothetical protein